jgi:hypothetical protein
MFNQIFFKIDHSKMASSEIILYYHIIPPIFFFIALFGNIMALAVLLRKNLINIGARNIYRYLFIADTLFVLQLIIDATAYYFDYDATTLSLHSCKIYYYFSYTLASISPMLLVYISIERFISIRYPAKKFTLRSNRNQFIYLICVIAFNLTFYFPYLFSFEFKIESNNKNETLLLECNFKSLEIEKILSLMDLLNRVCIPSILVTITTHMLIFSIFKSRTRVLKNFTSQENRIFKKDIRFAISSITLNIFYISLTLPLPLLLIFDKNFSDFAFHLTFSMFYSSYCSNFILMLASNSLFRNEFVNMFVKKNKDLRTFISISAERLNAKKKSEFIELI